MEEAALSKEQEEWLRPRGLAWTFAAWPVYLINRLLMRLCFRLRVVGAGQLPDQEQVIFAPNHLSPLDAPILAAALSFRRLRRTRWIAKREVVNVNGFVRGLSRLAGAVPIEAERDSSFSNLPACSEVLRRGEGLILFPEGHVSPDGRLQPFHTGIGVLMDQFKLLAIPVGIRGTREVFPAHGRRVRFRPVTLFFGPAARAEQLAAEGEGETPADRITGALRARIAVLASAPGSSILATLDPTKSG